jgi:hypothetical protein
MPEEPLTLNELFLLRTTLEARADQLRQQLHELSTACPEGWAAQFEFVQGTLIGIVNEVGGANRRIRVLVEGETVSTQEDPTWPI